MTVSLFANNVQPVCDVSVITKHWHYSLIKGQMNTQLFLIPVVLFIHLDSFDVSHSVLEVTSCDVCLPHDIMELDGTLLSVLKVTEKIHLKLSAAIYF